MESIFKSLDDGYIKYKNKTISVVIDGRSGGDLLTEAFCVIS